MDQIKLRRQLNQMVLDGEKCCNPFCTALFDNRHIVCGGVVGCKSSYLHYITSPGRIPCGIWQNGRKD
jgi:hypothetical protein